MVRKAVLLAAALLILISCGRNTTELGTPPTSTVREDPALTAAANTVQPVLETTFAATFAGLELRHDVPVMVVYRKPDPRLDAEMARLAPGVRAEFRDAKYTLTEMKAAGTRVMDDLEYWKGRGAHVNAVGPETDGSGVRVYTHDEPRDLATLLRERYPDMAFSVRRGGEVVFPMHTGSMPVLPSSPVRQSK